MELPSLNGQIMFNMDVFYQTSESQVGVIE